ncbi:MAG: hypothetical protein LBN36_04455 [Clostridiales Family XIII bacterium]|jgi:hypothetical protein|nr:hypothetical protein [Clostridiales Family XIII bacterium]
MTHCLKNFISKVAAILLVCIIAVTTGAIPVYAAVPADNGDVAFNGTAAPEKWTYDNGFIVTAYGSSDLFGAATKEMMPGATTEFDIRLRNQTADLLQYTLFATLPTTAELNAAAQNNPGKTISDGLLDFVNIRLTYAGGVIYDGNLRGTAAIPGPYSASGAVLGWINPGAYGTIHAVVTIDPALANAYKSTLCAVDWAFRVDELDPAVNPPGSGTPPGQTQTVGTLGYRPPVLPADSVDLGTGPISEISDPDVPLEGVDVIADPEVPLIGAGQAWALLNLIATILTALLIFILWAVYFSTRRGNGAKRKRLVSGVIAIVVAVIAIAVFILTEDMTLPMRFTDKYTLWMLLILAAQIAVWLVAIWKTEEDPEDSEEAEA